MTYETHELPAGQKVYYRDSNHEYSLSPEFKRDSRLPGISTIAKIADLGADPLLDWASRLTCEGMARQVQTALSLPEGTEDVLAAWNGGDAVWDLLKREGLTWRQIREEAGFRGYDAHEVLRALAEGNEYTIKTGYDEAVIAWWMERDPKVLQSEQVVLGDSDGSPYAGRFDLRCEIDGQTVLLDCKTSKYIGRSFAVQLNLYLEACKHSGIGDADRLVVLQVKESGEYREVDIPTNPLWAHLAVGLYEAGKDIDRGIRASLKAAEEAWNAVNEPLAEAA